MAQHYLALDYGGSSGRGMLGSFDGRRLSMKEIHRFQNDYAALPGEDVWDLPFLYSQGVLSVKKAMEECGGHSLKSIGIDTWGTDYGLIDKNGYITGQVRCSRNSEGAGLRYAEQKLGRQLLFERTGLQSIPGNTLYQLAERRLEQDIALDQARYILMLPDLLSYLFTGEPRWEYTAAATSMLVNIRENRWDYDLMRRLSIFPSGAGTLFLELHGWDPENMLGEILLPAERKDPLRSNILEGMDTAGISCVMTAGHDTASAVAGAPIEEGEAFLSSGTWSLLGIEVPEPVLDENAFLENIANEGLADGGRRLTKNRMGMWVLQRYLLSCGVDLRSVDWESLLNQARAERPFACLINLEKPEFYQDGDMKGRLVSYCRRTGQTFPDTIPAGVRCICESMALGYRRTVEQMERVSKKQIRGFCVVGGGGRNKLLNQFTANALNRPVHVGCAEAASAGNILLQAAADGQLSGMEEIKSVIRDSFPQTWYEPNHVQDWEEAYAAYRRLAGTA